ncbi:hypothetical protein HBA47_04045 [Kingella kingae]|nr:hypothetical protein [Kingella kingae]QIP47179.1 hypothetical protein HBA47_04045 [Kingella kingae]
MMHSNLRVILIVQSRRYRMESSKQEIVQTVVNNPELLNEVISTQEA